MSGHATIYVLPYPRRRGESPPRVTRITDRLGCWTYRRKCKNTPPRSRYQSSWSIASPGPSSTKSKFVLVDAPRWAARVVLKVFATSFVKKLSANLGGGRTSGPARGTGREVEEDRELSRMSCCDVYRRTAQPAAMRRVPSDRVRTFLQHGSQSRSDPLSRLARHQDAYPEC